MVLKLKRVIAAVTVRLWWLYSEEVNDPVVYEISREAALAIGVKPFRKVKLCKRFYAINAAVVGPMCTCIVLTEFLLKCLSKDEVKAVLLHEYAHCKLRHQMKLLTVSTLLLIGLSVPMAATVVPAGGILMAIPMLVAVYLLVLLIARALARRFELEADCLAVSKLGNAEVYIGLLRKTAPGIRSVSRIRALFDTHPSIDERIRHVLRCSRPS